jgi:hypothetical protein
MGQATGAAEVAQEITEVEAAMREASVTIQIRGIGTYHLKEIQRRFPSDDENLAWDVDAGAPAHCSQPAWWSPPRRTRRASSSSRERVRLQEVMGTCFLATTGSSAEVPFSERASALMAGSGSN